MVGTMRAIMKLVHPVVQLSRTWRRQTSPECSPSLEPPLMTGEHWPWDRNGGWPG